MTTTELLIAAKDKISNPKNWTTHAAAKDVYDKQISVYSKEAVCWCSMGAVESLVDPTMGILIEKAWQRLREAAGCFISEYNDSHTHEEVMELFDKAIELGDAYNVDCEHQGLV
jgi:hypothetical protein